MDIDDQARNTAALAEARQALPELMDALAFMAEYAQKQHVALKAAGMSQASADRLVGQWWSDMLRGQAR